MTPLVSVLIPVFNAEKYIRESVESILGQTYSNIEILVVNDGSSDGSYSILKEIKDERIILLNQENQGVAVALNRALNQAKGKYISRQDADDISFPNRIEKEVVFMEENKQVGLVGAWATVIDSQGKSKGQLKHSVSNRKLQYDILWDSPFVSSTTMFRKDCLEKTGMFYEGNDLFEDYSMWSSISRNYELANIPEILIKYRELSTGLSFTTANSKTRLINQRRKNISHHFSNFSETEIEGLAKSGFERTKINSISDLKKIYDQITKHFITAELSSADKENIKRDLLGRLHSFRWLTGQQKNMLYYPGRAIEKLLYPFLLK